MPREKKQHLKQRKDGRYACRYGDKWFMAYSESEALEMRKEYIRHLESEEYIRENPTVSQYAVRWLKTAKAGVSMKTYNTAAVHIEHLIESIGDLYIRKVRPSDIKKVYTAHYSKMSDGYIRHAKSLYTQLFRAAVEDGIIKVNPVTATTAKPHKGKTGSHRAITPEERKLIETVATDHPMHVAAIIMLYAGLRPQEVKALRMEDIDEEYIHVRNFVHFSGTNKYSVTSVGKTKKAGRVVPLFPPVAKAIKGKKGLILSNAGEIASPTAWRWAWKSYCNQIERHLNGVQKRWYGKTREHKALLADKKPLPPWIPFEVKPYDLRHSFATWCRDNGVELHTVVDWMGHADATMILRIYDEVTSKRNQAEAKRLKEIAFKTTPKTRKKVRLVGKSVGRIKRYTVRMSNIKGFT